MGSPRGKVLLLPDFQARLAEEKTKVEKRAASAASFYARWRPQIQKYRGGMPAGFMAAIAQWESGGSMASSGDPDLGEYGFFQITASTPPQFGLGAELRKNPEGNIFLAGLEYQVEAKRLALRYPGLVREGTRDQWMLARLVFAIGGGGTRKLIDGAKPQIPGKVYDALLAYVDATGGVPLGSQSAGKVWLRVHIVPLTWQIGELVMPGAFGGLPTRIASPRGVTYRLPKDVREHMRSGAENTAIAIGFLGLSLVIPGV